MIPVVDKNKGSLAAKTFLILKVGGSYEEN